MRIIASGLATAGLTLVLSVTTTAAAPITFSASGSSPAGIQATVDAYRADLGTLNPNQAGSFGSGRREINWDGVPNGFSAPNNLPPNFFNANSPRGAVLTSTVGTFQVRENTASGTQVRFGNFDPSYTANFQTFSPERLFVALGTNVMEVQFFVPGSNTPAAVRGFGSVFTDAETAGATNIDYFNGTTLLG